MKKLIIYILLAAGMVSCFAPTEMQVRVTPLGEEVAESTAQYFYLLPRTVLKVEVTTQEMKHVPGPYMEYAERYLGITEVIRGNFSRWQIQDVAITAHQETDPGMLFQVHQLEGSFDPALLDPFMEKGLILDGSEMLNEGIRSSDLGGIVLRDFIRYQDLGIESNFADRTETMYKTIVTDTSFVEVPVSRTITEQKSPALKAKEAADFILEVRTRRFELLTGGYDFPQGEAMEAALDKLDELEKAYLTLFTGKTLATSTTHSWFIVPDGGADPNVYRLGVFSEFLGFVPEDLGEGEEVILKLEPMGTLGDMSAYFDKSLSPPDNNVLRYRLPDVVDLQFQVGGEMLSKKRISIFQSGTLVEAPLK
jgi:hypothetical protein